MIDAAPDFPASIPRLGSSAGGVIVCERSGRWASMLRRELTEAGVRLSETRDLDDAWLTLATMPAAMLIVELTEENVAILLQRIVWLSRDFPRSRIIVVTHRRLAGYEWLAREAGAAHFACSPRRMDLLAELVLRHLVDVPMPQQTLVQRIWSSLPWAAGQQKAILNDPESSVP